MFIEPGIEVNQVKDRATAQTDARHMQLRQQRDTDSQVDRRLFLRQTTHGGQRQVGLVHHMPCLAR